MYRVFLQERKQLRCEGDIPGIVSLSHLIWDLVFTGSCPFSYDSWKGNGKGEGTVKV